MNTLRSYLDSDKINIVNLLAILDVSLASGYARFGSDYAPYVETVILERDGMFKGFGSLWAKNLHDKRIYITTYCIEDENFIENISTLYEKLVLIKNEKFSDIKFQTAYPLSLEKHRDFYEGYGFKEVMKTYSVELPINQLEIVVQDTIEANIIESLQNSTFYLEKKEDILNNLIENYELSHKHNPPKQVDRGFWYEMYLGEYLLEEYSFLMIEGGIVEGVLLVRKTEEPTTVFVEVIVFQKNSKNVFIGVNLLLDTFLRTVRGAHFFDFVVFELDDADLSSREVIKALHIQDKTPLSNVLVTLQEA